MRQSRRDLIIRAAAAAAVAGLPRWLWALESESSTAIDAARKAERWIRASRVVTKDGVTWPADPLKPGEIDRTFYNGTPGIVLFLLELHAATGDKEALAEARRGADDLVAALPTYKEGGLYDGLAGTAWVLAEVGRATGDSSYATHAKSAMLRATEQSSSGDAALVNDIVAGTAGIGLAQLWFGMNHAAVASGKRLLQTAQPEQGGLKWSLAPAVKNLYPNFSHGTAGVSYFLATLYERTKDTAYLDAALAGVRYLDAVAARGPNSYKVFHHEPGGTDLFYLSWCHGPVGTARLFHRLWKATGESQWLDRVHLAARTLIAEGVPETRSAGYWNNVSQCCGDAGVGEFFVAMCGVERRDDYVRMVERCERRILERATEENGGLKWIQAEHRVRPELLVAQTGFMQGAAGTGTFLLHADGMRRGVKPWARMPDNPFV